MEYKKKHYYYNNRRAAAATLNNIYGREKLIVIPQRSPPCHSLTDWARKFTFIPHEPLKLVAGMQCVCVSVFVMCVYVLYCRKIQRIHLSLSFLSYILNRDTDKL